MPLSSNSTDLTSSTSLMPGPNPNASSPGTASIPSGPSTSVIAGEVGPSALQVTSGSSSSRSMGALGTSARVRDFAPQIDGKSGGTYGNYELDPGPWSIPSEMLTVGTAAAAGPWHSGPFWLGGRTGEDGSGEWGFDLNRRAGVFHFCRQFFLSLGSCSA